MGPGVNGKRSSHGLRVFPSVPVFPIILPMSSLPSARRRWLALGLSVIPGWGHGYWGRERLGLTVFTVAAVLGFAWINGLFVYRGAGRTALVWGAAVALVLVAVGTWAELLRRTRPGRVEEEEGIRERRIREATAAYVRGEDAVAIESLRECVRLFPQDVESLFRLGVISTRVGERRAALRWLHSALRHDVEEKWRWEIEHALNRLSRERGGAGSSPREETGSVPGESGVALQQGSGPDASRLDRKEDEEAERVSA